MKSNSGYSKLDEQAEQYFKEILSSEQIIKSDDAKAEYAQDQTEDLKYMPDLVLKPANSEQVAQIMRYCHNHHLPVTTVGARTGLSGGALPLYGGIVLSTEKMNRILHIDEANLQATVEPGVINQVFHEACREKGLFYPPDPSSWGSCFIGGNLALNAGGPKAVKYGVTNAYVLSLEVVLASGEIINTGARVLKNSTGYNLTQLMVGSEGTLGVITKATFKLLPYPKHNKLLLVPFPSATQACAAVSAIFRAGITPSAMEFMERDAIDYTLKFVEEAELPIADHIQAHLLIEVDGNEEEQLWRDCEQIAEIVAQFDAEDPLFADTEKEKEKLWKLRRRVGEAVKSHSIYKEEDTVVPRAELPTLLKAVKDLGKEYGFHSVCYGHAGDGNLHVNILKGELSDRQWKEDLPRAIRELFKVVKDLGGTISGEHGIGLVQKEYLDVVFNPTEIALQKAIKAQFDPHGILNPGKIFP